MLSHPTRVRRTPLLVSLGLIALLTACPQEDKSADGGGSGTGFDFDLQIYNGSLGSIDISISKVGVSGSTTNHTLSMPTHTTSITKNGAVGDQFTITATVGALSGSATCTVGPAMQLVPGDQNTGFGFVSVFASTTVTVDCGTNWQATGPIRQLRAGSLSPIP